MILLDSDVLLLDLRYKRDPKYAANRQALERLRTTGIPASMTSQAFLEVVGILSFNVSPADVPHLPSDLILQYGLIIVPDPQRHPDYAGCTTVELVTQMSLQMALADSVQAVQIARYASHAICLLTWNARHFKGKLVIPAFTPQEWLDSHPGSVP